MLINKTSFKKGHKPMGNYFKKGHIPWSKGKRISEYEKIVCKTCKKDFEALKCSSRIYCSRKCMYLGRPHHPHSEETKRKIGISNSIFFREYPEKLPTWNGGSSLRGYGKWFKPLRELIRKRDNYTCKLCNKKQNGEKFSVHHIDYVKENYELDNLITLCRNCHARTNINRNYWREYFYAK